MKHHKIFVILTLAFACHFFALSQHDITYEKVSNTFLLENDLFSRTIFIDNENNGFYTISYKDKRSGYEFWREEPVYEFLLKINGQNVNGSGKDIGIIFENYNILEEADGSKILHVMLKGEKGSVIENININLFYQIYKDVAVVRKWIEIDNQEKRK